MKEIESVGFENCMRFANSVRFEKKKKNFEREDTTKKKKIQETQRE